MKVMGEIEAYLEADGLASHVGYAPTGTKAPYIVQRPMLLGDDLDRALNGASFGWDVQIALYCAGASVEASFALAARVVNALDGKTARGTTLATSVGYIGAIVEGHYETMVTVQLNQGGIS